MRYVNHISEVLYIKRILGQVRKAIQDFDMIQEGDRIAIGVSGGKDSLTLLLALRKLMDFYPKRFELEAVTINILNCNKVALAHNRDDAIETLLMSTFYEGRIYTFSPVTYLARTQLHVIRPLVYVEEKRIKALVRQRNLQIVQNPCKANGRTKRQYFKQLLLDMSKDNREVKSNLFGAILRSGLEGWHK